MYGGKLTLLLASAAICGSPATTLAGSVLDLVTGPRSSERRLASLCDLTEHDATAPEQDEDLATSFGLQAVEAQTPRGGLFTLRFEPDPTFPEAVAMGLGGRAMTLFYEDPTLRTAGPDQPLAPLAAIDDGIAGGSGDGAVDVRRAVGPESMYWALGVADRGFGSRVGHRQNESVTRTQVIETQPPRTDQTNFTSDDTSVLMQDRERTFINPDFTVDFTGAPNNSETVRTIVVHEQCPPNFAVVPVPPALAMGAVTLGGMGVSWLLRKRRAQA